MTLPLAGGYDNPPPVGRERAMESGFAAREWLKDENTGGNFAASRVQAAPYSMEKEILEG